MGNKKVGTSISDDEGKTSMLEAVDMKQGDTGIKADDEITNDNSAKFLPAEDPHQSLESIPVTDVKAKSTSEDFGMVSIDKLTPASSEDLPVTFPEDNKAVDEHKGTSKQSTEENKEVLNDDSHDEEEEDEGPWELKKIMSMRDLANDSPIKCTTENCPLPAGVVYSSVSNRKLVYYYCLDCQVSATKRPHNESVASISRLFVFVKENDFEGWPPIDELPEKSLSKEHQKLLVAKCSKYKDTAMPAFSEPPAKATKSSTTTNTVTPPPHTLQSRTFKTKDNEGLPVKTLFDERKKKAKPSKAQLEMHRKWQEAAESLGGADARIVLSKPAAKKIIYEFLYDAFRPCTITEIYEVR